MTPQLEKAYRKERSLGWPAQGAIRNARTRILWAELEDDRDRPGEIGVVRLKIEWDDCPDLSYLDQDCFAKDRAHEYARANRDGVVGIVGQYWDGSKWRIADSVWGFIGDDWRNSGYDTDVMCATLDAALAATDDTG